MFSFTIEYVYFTSGSPSAASHPHASDSAFPHVRCSEKQVKIECVLFQGRMRSLSKQNVFCISARALLRKTNWKSEVLYQSRLCSFLFFFILE